MTYLEMANRLGALPRGRTGLCKPLELRYGAESPSPHISRDKKVARSTAWYRFGLAPSRVSTRHTRALW